MSTGINGHPLNLKQTKLEIEYFKILCYIVGNKLMKHITPRGWCRQLERVRVYLRVTEP